MRHDTEKIERFAWWLLVALVTLTLGVWTVRGIT